MKKKVAVEELEVEVVDIKDGLTPVSELATRQLKHPNMALNPYVYECIGNDVPWFEVLLVHPNEDPKTRGRTPMLVNSLAHTHKYEEACTTATMYAMQENKKGARFIPVSRDGWPPNAAWNYP